MERLKIIRATFLAALIVGVLHVFAVIFSLYVFYGWFDIPMHFFGGFLAGLFAVWTVFYAKEGALEPRTLWKTILTAFLGSLLVGLIWEFFEYAYGLTGNALGSYALDTIKDLIMDMLGGLTAGAYLVSNSRL
jgi:hypothetical protein